MSDRFSFIRRAAITFATQITTIILGIIAGIIIARALGPTGKGIYTLYILVPTLLAAVGNLGVGLANVYLGGSKQQGWDDLIANSLISGIALGIPLTLIFAGYYLVSRPAFLQELDPQLVLMTAGMLPFSLLTLFFSHILLGQNRIKEYNLVTLLPNAVSLILLSVLLLVLKMDVVGAILAWAVATVVTTVLSMLLVYRRSKLKWRFQPAVFKESIKFGVKGYLVNVIQLFNYRFDMILVALFMSATFVGYYSISVSLAEALWLLPGAVGTVIFAQTPGLSAEESNKLTPVICRNTLFITLVSAALLFVLGKYIILLMIGPDFLPALQPFWILLPGMVAGSVWKVLGNEIAGRGKPQINTIASAVALAVHIPLNLVLVPRIGIVGAALAMSVAYTVTAVMLLIYFRRISGSSLVNSVLVRPGDFKLYGQLISAVWRRLSSVRERPAAVE
ncbi:MAG: oligosaccharide flippase family protein [Dehalococcoidales bacterium]|nr:oligosaccharide flippase family protein [Dehalococcoidales bacterium]